MARKKKKEKKERHWRPQKADREAFQEGKLTPDARRMNQVVDQAFRAHAQHQKAEERYEERMQKIYDRIAPGDRGITVINASGDRRVVYQKKNIVAGNQNAYIAKGLIDEYVSEMLHRRSLSEDDRQMAEFLSNVITESKGRIMLTKNLVTYKRMRLEDKRLKKAQKLLDNAFDVTESKLYWYVEKLNSKKEWERV